MAHDFFEGAELKRGAGCDKCSLGYKGRMGIYEIFNVEDSIVKLIFRGVSSTIIKERARELGMRNLRSVLMEEFGLDLEGWRLESAVAISADGQTIAGNGTNPAGQAEGWIAVVPRQDIEG